MSEDNPPKKVMSDEALQKLAIARQKALQVRRQQKIDKLKAETKRLEEPTDGTPVDESPIEPVNDSSPTKDSPPEDPPPPPKKKKPPPKADPVVVVEDGSRRPFVGRTFAPPYSPRSKVVTSRGKGGGRMPANRPGVRSRGMCCSYHGKI